MAHAEYIANALNKDIKDYLMQNFQTSTIDMRIHPVSSAFEVYDLGGRWIGFNKYVFEASGCEPKEMFVTVDRDLDVKVKYKGQFRRVSEYLADLRPVDPWADSTPQSDKTYIQWQQQADWWKKNGKVFRLQDLPAEIRDLIYGHYWGPIIEPFPTDKIRNIDSRQKAALKLRIPKIMLLLSSRAVYQEASHILYLRRPFLVEHYKVLGRIIQNWRQRLRIRMLDLKLSHDEFMYLFSTDHVRTDRKTGTEEVGFGYPALALRNMRFNHLRLTFAPPSSRTNSSQFNGACQKGTVGAILEAAWPILRGHPVELCGYIKDSQKQIYDARFLLERKKIALWQEIRLKLDMAEGTLAQYDDELDEEPGGVFLVENWREEMDEFDRMPALQYDLECQCDPTCTEETWSAEG